MIRQSSAFPRTRYIGKVYLEADTIHLLSVRCTPSTRKVQKIMQSADLTRASNIVIWNKWFLSFLGLWPCKVNQPLFVFFTTYMVIYCVIAANHLIKHIDQPDRVVANLTDNVLLTMILGKMIIIRRSSGIMAKFLKSIEADFTTAMYETLREKMAYLYYNEIALIFIKISMSMTAFTAGLYYFRVFFLYWSASVSRNFSYELPYPVHPFFEIKDTPTYICVCIYLFICVPIITCGYGGPDAYILSLALHICGQFAALSCKVNNLLKDHENHHRHMSNIIVRHYHLIRLAEILENNFNMICLQQTLGTVLLLCLTVYHMISNTEEYGEDTNTNVIAFALYTTCVVGTILSYCFIGECLITESAGLREAFYNSDWYNNPPSNTKLIGICMIRSEKPLILTAGRFYALSLNTFTSIVKTSMAYLSVLRHFL
ncbi:PREDICTED: odorant receptor 22c-like [Wasmannia auropunctata]|uniref:odorant receptor 22c-like n=1 Tax=Wasmannia auropunctata TaxID=64793 RepID=UPI0005EE59FD|nr:PREDICTED: odorant receptor 22c-like [Wasmannia auropunctata]